MAVDLGWTGPAQAACPDASLAFDLTIDGVQVLFQDQASPPANLRDLAQVLRAGSRAMRASWPVVGSAV